MPKAHRFAVTGNEKSDLPILARIKYQGRYVLQDDLSAISYNVKNFKGEEPEDDAGIGDLTVSESVYDELQTDDRWKQDTVGYNFQATIPAAALPTSGQHIIEFKFTPVSGSPFWIVVEASLLALHSAELEG